MNYLMALFIAVMASKFQKEPLITNPLMMANRGFVQCYHPDIRRRTCFSIATYRRTVHGMYENKAIMLVSPDGPTTLETNTTVVIERGAECGSITADDIRAGILRIGGQRRTRQQANSLLERLVIELSPVLNQKICTLYVPSRGGFITRSTVAGHYHPDLDDFVTWVRPDEGYAVAP
jgi:hypothetical protein